MPINKGSEFECRDIYIDYPFEEVMFRWDHVEKKIYVCFYGEKENPNSVPHSNRLYNDALLGGDELTLEEYEKKAGIRE